MKPTMSDLLNTCIKCSCSLAAADKSSRLLPCLHSMCEYCLSGKTDVLEKLKKIKEARGKDRTEQKDETKEKEAQNNEDTSIEEKKDDAAENTEEKTNDGDKSEAMDISEEENQDSEKELAQEKGNTDQNDSVAQDPVITEEELPQLVPLSECPKCREPFSDETVIENIFVRKHLTTMEGDSPTEQLCTGCESHPASAFCVQCGDWLCADCIDAHKRVRMTKDHTLTSREEAVVGASASDHPSEVSMMCRSHPKEKLTLFCDKCEVLTCRDCQLLHHQEHKYHFLQEASESYKAKLSGSLSLMKERREALQHQQAEIEERLSRLKKEKGELQQEVLRQADVIVKAVRAAVWSVLTSLTSFTDAAAKRLSREVGDVGDLVAKFDHCITFMEAILQDGLGLPLLFSKAVVEAKCRKVYHTHMEPQSLKGQLKISYRHDVNAVIRSLNHIGAIYVNGSKYPPEKQTSTPTQPAALTNLPVAANAGYRNSGNIAPGNVVVGAAVQPHPMPPNLAPQDRSMYMQMMMRNSSIAQPPPPQGPILALPSRRAGVGPRPWPAQSSSPMMGGGMMVSQAQSMMQPRPFQPMRLHHRPEQALSSGPPMMLVSQSRSQPMTMGGAPLSAHLPAPPPLRSPQPSYRGAAESVLHGSAAQAAMSSIRRLSSVDSPDPARPASAGHNMHTPERPLSAQSDGASPSSGVKIKSEPTESGDCVITSAVIKGEKSSSLGSCLGELQKNLDDVIRGVPLDLGDNLEQINGDNNSMSSIPALSSPPLATSTSPASANTLVINTQPDLTATGENLLSNGTVMGRSDLNHAFEATGPQVHGYATGNSMPGFTLAAVDADPNDDYCAVCHQGGDVLCCDRCPRVYHLQCHVPAFTGVPDGEFVCALCDEDPCEENVDSTHKRKAPTGLTDTDVKICERILLELFCHPSSIPFHEPVNRAVPNYYKIIVHPMDFTNIKCKLSRTHFNHYTSVEAFLTDIKLVFSNCAVYNAESSEVGKAGKIVCTFFEKLIEKYLPAYTDFVQPHLDGDNRNQEAKKRKTTPPPPPSSSSLEVFKERDEEPLLHIH